MNIWFISIRKTSVFLVATCSFCDRKILGLSNENRLFAKKKYKKRLFCNSHKNKNLVHQGTPKRKLLTCWLLMLNSPSGLLYWIVSLASIRANEEARYPCKDAWGLEKLISHHQCHLHNPLKVSGNGSIVVLSYILLLVW